MKILLASIAIFFGYYLTAKLGLSIPFIGSQITLIWLPTGISIAGLYRFSWKMAIPIFASAFYINYETNPSISLACLVAFGNTAGPVLAAYFLKYYKFHHTFPRRKDLFLFLFIASLSMIITASNGVSWLVLFGVIPIESISGAWLTWWLGDSIGAFLAGIPLISFSRKLWISDFKEHKGLENLVASICLFLVGIGLFGIHPFVSPFLPSIVFLPLLFLIWVSMNSSVSYSTFVSLLLSLLAIFATINRTGPFVNNSHLYNELLILWSYLVFIMLITTFVNILTIEIKDNSSALDIINHRTPGILFRIEKDQDGIHFQFLSKNTKPLLGISFQEHKETFLYRVHTDDIATLPSTIQMSAKRLEPFQIEVRVNIFPQSTRWIQLDAVPELTDNANVVWSGFMLDVTERKASEDLILENEENLRGLFTLSPIGIALIELNGKIIEMNDACEEIFSITDQSNQNLNLWEIANIDDETLKREILKNIYLQNKFNSLETIILSPKYEKIYLKIRGILVKRNTKESVWVLIENITSFKEYKAKLEYIALYDYLTGLPNRSLLTQKIEKLISFYEKENLSFALCYLDLDEFKSINDSFGPEIGDELLKKVAFRLRDYIGEDGILGRIGGDEFIIILEKISSRELLENKLYKILSILSERFLMKEEIDISVYASIGVTIYPEDESNADSLLRHADIALYNSKQKGKNTFHIFDPQTDKDYKQKQERFFAVKKAFENKEFTLFFQPIIDLQTYRVVGAECLLRWIHPTRGIIPPSEFIPTIENTDLTTPMGEWILEQSFAYLRKWKQRGFHFSLSVNLFSKHLQSSGFYEFVYRLVHKNPDVPIQLVKLEILETTAMEDIENVTSILEECKKLGMDIVLDDFGTAYSSLTYLKRLPTGSLKIDQSFIRQMLEKKEDLAIVKGILGLAKEFQRTVVAEGVETGEQAKILQEMGCQFGQGYYFSKPLAEEDFLKWTQNFDQQLIPL